MRDEVLVTYDQTRMSPEEFLEEVENEMMQIMADQNYKYHFIKDMLSGQQIIVEEISAKIVIVDKLNEEISEVIVPVGGLLYTNRVIPDTAKKGLRELSEVSCKINAKQKE